MRAIVRHFESSAPLEAPLQTVWRELADVTAWPDWVPTVTALEPLDSPSLRVGARYAIVQRHGPGPAAAIRVGDEITGAADGRRSRSAGGR
jgi:hypothetical protein